MEFIARHNLNHSTNAPFSSENLINISEIGLVVHDVPAAQKRITSHFAIDEYKDSYETFAAIGDEDGLFILSVYNRTWFGSNLKGAIYKTEVEIEGDIIKGELILGDYPYKIISS
ncbi:hypothetical protein I6N90_16925 [Paenibacillus sp. GSMTC-2017]|uniref:hypothetical protein n=1 Tax=Paenibacillus sp. GSMTC-2017 TaxID=2794350 RepID=UPI0018D65348|nr:hypothetical protein [Paenibacillus sp. GSMTC-2017]MBH5319481.1 hypothetical protein [Paenibacillus sp. GSMTC-2017]